MARPKRNNVDYFPHYISDGKKMFYFESKYGNDGYAMWFKLLEKLAQTDYHYINFKDETELMYMAAKCRVDEDTLINFLNELAKFGEINNELWSDCMVVYSEKFIDSIKDAYSKRNNKLHSLEGLRGHLLGLGVTKGGVNTQSKVKYSIVKESKVKDSLLMSQSTIDDISEMNKDYFEIASAFYHMFESNASKLGVKWKHLEKTKAEEFIKHIRLMIVSDERTIKELQEVWAFLSKDEFWMTNIQSSKKLREKFDQLITKAKTKTKTNDRFSESATADRMARW